MREGTGEKLLWKTIHHELDNLEEWILLKTYNLPRLNHKEIGIWIDQSLVRRLDQ